MMKGLSKDMIDKIYQECQIDSKQNALYLARKKVKNKEITKELLSKTYKYIISKGFSYEDANYVIEQLKGNDYD